MNLKVLQLNESHSHESHSNAQHEYPEAMFVTDGRINLLVDGQAVAVNAGGMYVVPPGMLHTVVPGSDGTLVIFE
jgi:mannose-6-phosphate isomerase-like protein (cupin superfamily)